jgi:hypothetical protein
LPAKTAQTNEAILNDALKISFVSAVDGKPRDSFPSDEELCLAFTALTNKEVLVAMPELKRRHQLQMTDGNGRMVKLTPQGQNLHYDKTPTQGRRNHSSRIPGHSSSYYSWYKPDDLFNIASNGQYHMEMRMYYRMMWPKPQIGFRLSDPVCIVVNKANATHNPLLRASHPGVNGIFQYSGAILFITITIIFIIVNVFKYKTK